MFDLECQMKESWPLIDCLVVDTVSGNANTTLDLVDKTAAKHLQHILVQHILGAEDVLAISGGKTLSTVADHLKTTGTNANVAVPIIGGVQGQHYTDVNHIATRIADELGASATLIHAPLHVDTSVERDMLLSVRAVGDVIDRARAANVSLLGLGAVAGQGATYYRAHPLSEDHRAQLFKDGIRAELLGHLVNARGSLCDNALNSCLVSLPLEEARQIPVRIGVATGKDKIDAVRAALNGEDISTLVIDDLTVQAVLTEINH
ncbi:sugar-binding domain-containing protein [Shimia sp. R9_3]|uniref:sugar-binding transcriptional regulator n=1 Tax=Shimia sp. R9_3 TaxID=2821113 RepID=UPI001B1F6972|nr:sugar-binding domain-containing protein [Shimia sp. R9_3]MBO9403378.1 sugar-binding transcriptional regulator [Shimia sp. R9_3]